MKFIRYGILKAFDHPDWDDDPNDDHAPPRRYGFYAFPYAFHDAFYMVRKPASDPDSIMQYVRDERGRKITGRAIKNYLKEYDLDDDEDAEYGNYRRKTDGETFLGKHPDKWLRQHGSPTIRGSDENRPSWVMVMKDADNPPYLLPSGKLSEEGTFLLDSSGARIEAREFFERVWRPIDFAARYRDWWIPTRPEHLNERGIIELYHRDDPRRNLTPFGRDGEENVKRNHAFVIARLARMGIALERLYAWPVYEEGDDVYLTIYKKPHVFDYCGNLWHHLDKYLRPGEALCRARNWVYTSTAAFERALRKVDPKQFRVHTRTQHAPNLATGGPQFMQPTLDTDRHSEVYLDAEGVRLVT